MALGSKIVKNLVFKIAGYLGTKEGCTVVDTEVTNDRDAFIVEDAFGFRYEVQVKMIGRNSSAVAVTEVV
jgi:HJR/Mrr/RecB family endonuclease